MSGRHAAVATALFAFALLAGDGIPADPEPLADRVPPKVVTIRPAAGTLESVLKQVQEQTGIPVEASGIEVSKACRVELVKAPFWDAMQSIAKAVDGRVAVRGGGARVVVEPGPSPPLAVSGPFRVVVRQVRSVTDFDTGKAYTELALDIQWEPRVPVYRISSQPAITAATDDRGTQLRSTSGSTKIPVSGYGQSTTVRIEGVPRTATLLKKVTGTFTVTTAVKMLTFPFDNLTGPGEQLQHGVTVRLKPLRKIENVWEAELELKYPADRPVFESFESHIWATRNRARLIAPAGAAAYDADADPDFPENPGRVGIVYRFTEKPGKKLLDGDRKGWVLSYQTPSPLLEYAVPFVLTDIPLP